MYMSEYTPWAFEVNEYDAPLLQTFELDFLDPLSLALGLDRLELGLLTFFFMAI